MSPRETRSMGAEDKITQFLKSEEFTNIISTAVRKENKILYEQIKQLQEEVVILRESNIELVNLLTNTRAAKMTSKKQETLHNFMSDERINRMRSKENKEAHKEEENPKINSNKENGKTQDTDSPMDTKENGNPDIQLKTKENNPTTNPTTKTRGITGANKDNRNIKAATKKTEIFVSRIHPSSKISDLQNYLSKDFPESICEELVSKHPEHYRSFKISIDAQHKNQIMDPNFWPSGIYVNHFFRRRPQRTSNSE